MLKILNLLIIFVQKQLILANFERTLELTIKLFLNNWQKLKLSYKHNA